MVDKKFNKVVAVIKCKAESTRDYIGQDIRDSGWQTEYVGKRIIKVYGAKK